MENRVYNFNAGPACLPRQVLEKAREEYLDYKGTGISILETSHRTKEFQDVLDECKASIKELLNLPDNFSVLFLQGGATLQFAMVPMNLLPPDGRAGYLVTGTWAKKALEEVSRASKGEGFALASTKEESFRRIPRLDEFQVAQDLSYVHLASNNTIYGTQWKAFPDTGKVPLVADMSSDMMSRPLDMNRFGLIYAGAQKNLGPAGVTLVLIRNDLLDRIPANLPLMLDYRTYVKNDSLYNTPPVGSIYLTKLTMDWLREQGGLEAIVEKNNRKSNLLYGTIDNMGDFYRGATEVESRSQMNVTFRLVKEDLEPEFISQAKKRGMIGLKGHRSVGGVRASIYNAVPYEAVEALVNFMKEFAAEHK